MGDPFSFCKFAIVLGTQRVCPAVSLENNDEEGWD